LGTVEHRGKNSWRIGTQVKIGTEWQWVRIPLRMDPELPEDAQRRAAERELRKLEDRLAGRPAEAPTVREWSETWLTKHLSQDASPVTVSNYRYLLNSRILPQLGDLPLTDLTPARLTDWLYNLRKEPRKSTRLPDDKLKRPRRQGEQLITDAQAAKPLSAKTAQNYLGCVKTMLAAAVRVGLLEYNPADRVQGPKRRKKKKTTLPEAEVIALLQLIITEAEAPLKLAVLLAMLCSLRLGEVGALKYSDIDWDAGTITVDRSLKYTPADGAFISEPKTDAGDRVITLPPSMVRILRDAMWDDVMEAQDLPDKWKGAFWIVHSRHGARVNKDTPSKWFRKFADDHGFQGLTFHGLRHVHASMLLQHRVDLQSVSVRMGHSDPSVTLRAYADAMPARDQEAAATMDRLLLATGSVVPAEPAADPEAPPAAGPAGQQLPG
jgi:integrase